MDQNIRSIKIGNKVLLDQGYNVLDVLGIAHVNVGLRFSIKKLVDLS